MPVAMINTIKNMINATPKDPILKKMPRSFLLQISTKITNKSKDV